MYLTKLITKRKTKQAPCYITIVRVSEVGETQYKREFNYLPKEIREAIIKLASPIMDLYGLDDEEIIYNLSLSVREGLKERIANIEFQSKYKFKKVNQKFSEKLRPFDDREIEDVEKAGDKALSEDMIFRNELLQELQNLDQVLEKNIVKIGETGTSQRTIFDMLNHNKERATA